MTAGSVIAVGRLSKQKDPTWFQEAYCAYRGDRPWIWVGGGNDEAGQVYEQRLTAGSVQVTGWLPQNDVFTMYQQAHVYVHTAAWEGNPMTLIEAAAWGLPILARDIPAVRAEGVEYLMTSPEHCARWVEQLDDEYQWRRAALWSCRWSVRYTQAAQRAALLKVYGLE